MDKFSGARHSAYTMRRFYPAMYGRNLTFMPSQYGEDDAAEKNKKSDTKPKTQREKSTLEVLGEIGGVLGARYVEGKLEEADIQREGLRLKYSSEAEARKISAQALADQMNRKPSNPIPWLIGGLGIVVVGGLVYYNMSLKKK